ncbi:MAG: urease accessory protein UreF [Microcoleaceae cyanobacterium]
MILELLQLSSPALPLGAYSYSEGLENLVEQEIITNKNTLEHWLTQELSYGAIRLEGAIMVRAYNNTIQSNFTQLNDWNNWLSAARESSELREQSWQMGNSLSRLLLELNHVQEIPNLKKCIEAVGKPCNYAVAFGMAAASWQIDINYAVLGYLQSWASNLITAGIKLIPLGQTAGQKILLKLHPIIIESTQEILALSDDNLVSCNWGLGLASMAHETQYTRLFRS